jgi:hypothetical protein
MNMPYGKTKTPSSLPLVGFRHGCVASTVFDPFRRLFKALERPSIKQFSKSMKHAVCLRCRRCNTSEEMLLTGGALNRRLLGGEGAEQPVG